VSELERRIQVATDAIHTAFTCGGYEFFVSGSSAILGTISTDVDVVVYAGDFDERVASLACSCLAVSGWDAPATEYSVSLWISFKKNIDGVLVNILLCNSRTVYDQAASALVACKQLAAAGVTVDKQLRVAIHRDIMGEA